MRVREALEIAIQGGAKNLGRDDVGEIAPGFAADFVAWKVGRQARRHLQAWRHLRLQLACAAVFVCGHPSSNPILLTKLTHPTTTQPPPARPAAPLPQLTGSVAFAGGLHDPVASLILCTPGYVDLSVINGEMVVRDGRLLTCDLDVSAGGVLGAAV